MGLKQTAVAMVELFHPVSILKPYFNTTSENTVSFWCFEHTKKAYCVTQNSRNVLSTDWWPDHSLYIFKVKQNNHIVT